MPKRKKPVVKPEEQFERFVATAREIGVDEPGHDVENKFKSLVDPTASYRKQKESRKDP